MLSLRLLFIILMVEFMMGEGCFFRLNGLMIKRCYLCEYWVFFFWMKMLM